MSPKRDLKLKKLVNYSSTIISNKKLLSHDVVLYLLKALESADYQLCVDIENDLVNMGKQAIDELINALGSPHEKVRSHAAMSLIRIGVDSIEPLLSAYQGKPELDWMVNFIISEIKGSQQTVGKENCYKSVAS